MNYLYKVQSDFDMDIGSHLFFQSFISTTFNNGLINEKDIEHINIQIVEILESQLRLHTRSLNSSVKTEVAQTIIQSFLYCISYFLKQFTLDECIMLVTKKPLSSILNCGRKKILEDIEKAKHILNTIKKDKIKTKNKAYNDTIKHGIPMFFSSYNVAEKAHETPSSIDYPVQDTEAGLVGIEYMTRYLEKLYFENEFCKSFNDSDIEALLFGYSDSYRDLLLNIFETLLTNIAGNVLLENSPLNINITEIDRLYLTKKLSAMPPLRLKLELANIATKIINTFNIDSELFKSHVSTTLLSIAHTIENAIKHNKLSNLFVSLNNKQTPTFSLNDSNHLTNEEFRNITNEIRSCRHTADKILIIKQNIKSSTDLIDLLSSYCITPDEYSAVFSSIKDIELALLLRHVSENTADSLHSTQGEIEWHNSLQSYIINMETIRKNNIYNIINGLVKKA